MDTHPLDDVQYALSDFETFVAADGIRSIRMRDKRTLPEEAQAAINATLEGDWLVEAIHAGVCEDSLEECRSEGRGHCVRGAAAVREAGIRRA